MILRKLLSYLLFWKPQAKSDSTSFNLKVMHGINKLSILMFLLAIIIMVVKFVIL